MNRQSDFGYATGDIEYLSKARCLRRAQTCNDLAETEPDEAKAQDYKRWAKGWADEAQRRD